MLLSSRSSNYCCVDSFGLHVHFLWPLRFIIRVRSYVGYLSHDSFFYIVLVVYLRACSTGSANARLPRIKEAMNEFKLSPEFKPTRDCWFGPSVFFGIGCLCSPMNSLFSSSSQPSHFYRTPAANHKLMNHDLSHRSFALRHSATRPHADPSPITLLKAVPRSRCSPLHHTVLS